MFLNEDAGEINKIFKNQNNEEIISKINKNRKILIVDDEPYNILGLTIILQQSGYPNISSIIDSAHNG